MPEVIDEEAQDVPAQTEPTAEEVAAFQEGYGDQPTEETPPTEPAAPEPTPPAEPTPDPSTESVTLTKAQWEETQARLQSLAATVEKVSGTAFGKIGGLERTLNELKERTPAGQSIKLTEEDFPKAMREDFPDLVRDQVAAFNKAVERGTASGITPEEFNRKLVEATTQVEQKSALRFMDGIRKDWRTIVNDAAYKSWLTSQPAEYQTKLADSWEPNDVLDSIEQFEAAQSAAPKAPAASPTPPTPPAKPAQPATRSRRMATAVQPKGQGTPTPTAKTEQDYFNEGYKTGTV